MTGPGGESISSSQSLTLDLPPSCIEFCPAHPDLFVVGTYNLEKSEEAQTVEDEEEKDEDDDLQPSGTSKQSQSRNGSIILFQLRKGKVHLIQTVSQPSAVFDLHFQPHPGKGDVFATVSSTGTISVFRLVVPEEVIISSSSSESAAAPNAEIIQPLSVLRIPDLDEGVLFTYFAWHPSIPSLIAVTTASGQVILAQIHDDYQDIDILENPILEHSLEAWIVAFSPPPQPAQPEQQPPPPPPFTILSGGDDSALKYTTYTPISFSSSSSSSSDPTTTSYTPITLRDHTAGVTAILPLPLPHLADSHIVLTGSYDDTLRAFSITPLHTTFGAKQTRLLASRNLGGGVWRLNMIGEPSTAITTNDEKKWAVTMLASCMHAGARVLRITAAAAARGGGCDNGSDDEAMVVEIEELARFQEHKSMNYGSDWSRVEGFLDADGKRRRVMVSTSFYDRLLCVWSVSV